jgi:di/tricarboxylate transporter
MLTHLPEVPQNTGRAAVAVAILALFLLSIAFNWLSVSLAALIGAIAVILTGCETIEQARDSIQWQVIFLIGGMLPLAIALEQVGITSIAVEGLRALVGVIGPRLLLLIFFLVTTILSQFTSGQAAALVVGPLAITSAQAFGVNPQAFAMAVAVGASTGFLSPISHPANLLVMGVGGYGFGDYSRLGAPLVLLAGIGVELLIPLAYPF